MLGAPIPRIAALAAIIVTTSCTLSHTPFQKRAERRRAEQEAREAAARTAPTPAPRKETVEDTRELHKSRPILRRSRQQKAQWPDAEKLDQLSQDLKAEPFAIEDPCVADDCPRAALDRVFEKLEKLEDSGEGQVRILHLGDSHVAADYITSTARKALQFRFKNAGRGFVMVDQRAQYGGRRLKKKGWKRTRAVDAGHSTEAFGFSAMNLESRKPGGRVEFRLDAEDAQVTLYYQTSRQGGRLDVKVDETTIGQLETRAKDVQTTSRTFRIPSSGTHEKLTLVADVPGVKIFGLSFENNHPGLFYDAVGPVGADARVYLSLDRKSFKQHLRALAPDLIVLMVGGNDALAMRKGIRTLDDVRTDHERIILALREAVPEADCMLWSPMDAAEMIDGKMESKKFISEVRNMQKAAASKLGCGFWDMFASMGSEDSFARWHRAGIMNDDLVHPRSAAGELLGHLFATSFLDAYGGGD